MLKKIAFLFFIGNINAGFIVLKKPKIYPANMYEEYIYIIDNPNQPRTQILSLLVNEQIHDEQIIWANFYEVIIHVQNEDYIPGYNYMYYGKHKGNNLPYLGAKIVFEYLKNVFSQSKDKAISQKTEYFTYILKATQQ